MILNETIADRAELSNIEGVQSFGLKASAKAYRILFSTLYSDRILAIVRELSCNARDSHAAAGHADRPFHVHLPTHIEPYLSIRDQGVGLSDDEVNNIYAVFFESTKTSSNEFVGALGLGSKSPFSYTSNFTVIAVKDGIRNVYGAYLNDQGIPSIARMSTEATTDCNGVEVTIAVEPGDINAFAMAAQRTYRVFEVPPVINGNSITITPIAYEDTPYFPEGIRLRTKAATNNYERWNPFPVAVMGGVEYPIQQDKVEGIVDLALSKFDLSDETKRAFAYIIANTSFELHFPIGALDFQPSREGLSYDPATMATIAAKIESLVDAVLTHATDEMNKCESLWGQLVHFIKIGDRYYAHGSSTNDRSLVRWATFVVVYQMGTDSALHKLAASLSVTMPIDPSDHVSDVPCVTVARIESKYGLTFPDSTNTSAVCVLGKRRFSRTLARVNPRESIVFVVDAGGGAGVRRTIARLRATNTEFTANGVKYSPNQTQIVTLRTTAKVRGKRIDNGAMNRAIRFLTEVLGMTAAEAKKNTILASELVAPHDTEAKDKAKSLGLVALHADYYRCCWLTEEAAKRKMASATTVRYYLRAKGYDGTGRAKNLKALVSIARKLTDISTVFVVRTDEALAYLGSDGVPVVNYEDRLIGLIEEVNGVSKQMAGSPMYYAVSSLASQVHETIDFVYNPMVYQGNQGIDWISQIMNNDSPFKTLYEAVTPYLKVVRSEQDSDSVRNKHTAEQLARILRVADNHAVADPTTQEEMAKTELAAKLTEVRQRYPLLFVSSNIRCNLGPAIEYINAIDYMKPVVAKVEEETVVEAA